MVTSKKLSELLLTAHLGLSPLYWFAKIPVEIILYGKYIIYALAVSSVWLATAGKGKVYFVKGIFGVWGFVTLSLLMVPGFLQSSFNDSLDMLLSLSYGFITIWTVYQFERSTERFKNVLINSALFVLTLSVLVIMSRVVGWPEWTNPYSGNLLSDTGFDPKRTGWALSTSLFVSILFIFSHEVYKNYKFGRKSFTFSIAIIIPLSQLVVGGRAGILASLAAYMSIMKLRTAVFFGMLLLVSSAMIIELFGLNEWLYERLRFFDLPDVDLTFRSMEDFESLDRFSSYRISQYLFAMQSITNNPFFGIGIVPFEEMGLVADIHNLWLRLGTVFGVGLPIAFILMIVFLIKKALRNAMLLETRNELDTKNYQNALIGTLVAGLVVSQFEALVLIGAYQTSTLWWASVGATLAITKKITCTSSNGEDIRIR